MDHLPCPACHTPLAPEATGCHICLRARSKQEIMRAYAGLRKEKARRRILPFKIAGGALILGAVISLSWHRQEDIKTAAATARSTVGRWSEDLTDAKRYSDHPAAAADEIPDSESSAAVSSLKQPPAGNVWRVSGVVYDLATLLPVPDANVLFISDGGSSQHTMTDKAGRYEVDVLRGAGWAVSVKAANYRTGQIMDVDPPYRERDAEARRAAVEHLSDADLGPSPVEWSRKRSRVTLDLVAVPYSWPQP